MGIDSNRLCMLLSMGIPIIASRQPSFEFLLEYKCGVLVDSFEEFKSAIDEIGANLDVMKANAKKCAMEYINAKGKYVELHQAISPHRIKSQPEAGRGRKGPHHNMRPTGTSNPDRHD